MGQTVSAERRAEILEECRREIYSSEKLKVIFPNEYNDEQAQRVASFIIANRATLKSIKFATRDDHNEMETEDVSRYLKDALDALAKSTQQSRCSMPLEELEVCGNFQLDCEMLTKLLWAAPKKLKIDGDVEVDAPDVDSSAHVFDWATCQLEDLDVTGYGDCFDDAGVVSMLTLLSRMTSLRKCSLSLDSGNIDGRLFDATKATDPLIEMMERNRNLEHLWISELIPEKELFCQQLSRATKLKHLGLLSLSGEPEYDHYLLALATVLREHPLLPLERFEFEDTGYKYPSWGPHALRYFTELNQFGRRQMMRSNLLTGEDLVGLLGMYCCQSAKANLAAIAACTVEMATETFPDKPNTETNSDSSSDANAGAFFPDKETKEEAASMSISAKQLGFMKMMAAFTTTYATSEEEQQLKDACMLYGLLRESPGIWSQMAIKDSPSDFDLDRKKPAKRKSSPAKAKNAKQPKLTKTCD